MNNVTKFPQKGKLPSQEQQFEQTLHHHREGAGAISLGESRDVARVSSGEEVEIDPVRFNSVFEIYSLLKKKYEAKDEAEKSKALQELRQSMGEYVDGETAPGTMLEDLTVGQLDQPLAAGAAPELSLPDLSEQVLGNKDTEAELHLLLERLARGIYQALEDCRESIAAIKPETIDGPTASHLGEVGDANFVVATGKGEKLYGELQSKDLGFDVIERNDYGFVLENQELNYRVVFVYQERLHVDGTPKNLEEIKPDEAMLDANQDATTLLTNQQANNQSGFGNGGSLAA